MLKALLNSYFLPILLDEKKKEDKRIFSGNRRAKVEKTLFEYVLLIIPLYWSSFCLFKTSIGICRENHIRKGKGDNLGLGKSTIDRDKRVDKPSIGIDIANMDKKTDNQGISTETADRNKGVDNPGTSINIADSNRETDDPDTSTNIANVNR